MSYSSKPQLLDIDIVLYFVKMVLSNITKCCNLRYCCSFSCANLRIAHYVVVIDYDRDTCAIHKLQCKKKFIFALRTSYTIQPTWKQRPLAEKHILQVVVL